MKTFEDEKHLLKNEDMDTLHKEFLDIYNAVNTNDKQDYRAKLITLLEHSKNHFSIEENLMDKFSYKTSKEHKEEHAKVLNEMEYFIKLSSNNFGLNMLQSYYKEKLPYWFDLHLISMDSDLAHHLKGQTNV
ncbi:MAG: hemerythrin family protein [Arcobacteraceae bacterium]|jgi:hemerythrin-like metal-binding protein|nr:hemerythrin family protein [Arcobacteraceae bacterium]